MAHSNASSAYATVDNGDMIFGSPSANGRIYDSHRTGADNGVAIASAMQTRWIEPRQGNLTRIRRARFVGIGEFTATIYKDYEAGGSLQSLDVDITPGSETYDSGVDYDSGAVYGPTSFQSFQDFYSIGVVRSASIRIEETSDGSLTGREIMGGDNVPEVGAWAISHIELWTIELGDR